MSCSFSTMLNRLKNYPEDIAFRKDWDSEKWLFVSQGINKRQVLYLHEGVHSSPYSVQQDDLFMNDWEVEHG